MRRDELSISHLEASPETRELWERLEGPMRNEVAWKILEDALAAAYWRGYETAKAVEAVE